MNTTPNPYLLAAGGTVPFGGLYGNDPTEDEAPKRKKGDTPFGQSKRRGAKRKRLEDEYAALIKAGTVRIVRHRGKPPEVVWLQ